MIKAVDKIRNALLAVTDAVYHYTAAKQKGNYIVFAEDSQGDSAWGDGKCTYQTTQGTIDYFTREEDDPKIEEIQRALNNGEIYWYYNSTQHEDDTGYIHHEWVWEVAD